MKKSIKGFTLIELLMATAIISVVSVVSVNLLFHTILNRSKQDSITEASEDIRNFNSILSKNVKYASSVNVFSATELRLISDKCSTIRLAPDNSIEIAEDASAGCTPPTSGFTKITSVNTKVLALNFNQSGKTLTYSLNGKNKDSLGEHSFSYNGKIEQRN